MSDFNITLFEACEILNKSKKTISRYIRQGRLNPQEVKSQRGTLEYRFSKADIEAFRADETGQETQDTPDKTGQSGQTEPEPKKTEFKSDKEQTRQDTPDRTERTDETGQKTYTADIKGKKEETGQDKTGQDNGIINLLQDTVSLLKDQLTVKDRQIDNLSGKIDELIQRDRETNILIGQLQSKVLMLERPQETEKEEIKAEEIKADETETAEDETEQTGQDTPDGTGQDEPEKKSLLRRIFG
jgi:hypothetical protein